LARKTLHACSVLTATYNAKKLGKSLIFCWFVTDSYAMLNHQLVLIESIALVDRDSVAEKVKDIFRLDSRTCDIGRSGISAARAALRAANPVNARRDEQMIAWRQAV
jgi:hypothetical protein